VRSGRSKTAAGDLLVTLAAAAMLKIVSLDRLILVCHDSSRGDGQYCLLLHNG
jgi:hypothetical protein